MKEKLFVLIFSLFCIAACTTKQCECETFHDDVLQESNTYTKFTTCSEYESEKDYGDYVYKVVCREI